MDHDRTKPAWKKSDLYLVAGCLLAALVCCGLWLLLRKDGLAVAVELEGKASARYALNEDRIVRIEGTEG